jgi:hypothetical protein
VKYRYCILVHTGEVTKLLLIPSPSSSPPPLTTTILSKNKRDVKSNMHPYGFWKTAATVWSRPTRQSLPADITMTFFDFTGNVALAAVIYTTVNEMRYHRSIKKETGTIW